jgi:TolB-like protein/Flp pilus assembly protein TadD
MGLWARIKEHKIAQWTLAYAAFAFASLHAATLLSDALEWPHAIVRALTLLLMIGLPIVPILAWYHGVRALRRVSVPEFILIALLLVIGGALLWRSPRPAAEPARLAAANPAAAVPMQPDGVPAAFTPPPHSIAVLPFVNMSGDAKQEYFSDGISEELLNALSRLNDLQVVARTSSFSFKGQNVDVFTIAHKLNVGAILEGSVRRAGNTVRITAQLINAVSGFHLWSQTYDRNLTDILKVQSEVATTVAQQLEIKLVGDEAAKMELGGTRSPEAYEAYLRGVELLSTGDVKEADERAALAALDRAVALDPNYAQAQTRRASALGNIAIFADLKPDELARLRQQALQAAGRAVALAPDLGEAHLALGLARAYDSLDFADAAPEFERALALSPGSARVQAGVAGFVSQLGHFEAATTGARRAVTLDPQNVNPHITLGQVLASARHYDEALTAFQAAKALRPSSIYISFNIAYALLGSGQFEQARQVCESPAIPPERPGRLKCLALAYHGLGRQKEADQALEQYKAIQKDEPSFGLAEVYALWGNKAAALAQLAKAWQQRDPAFQSLKVSWELDPIRNEPEFKAIEAKMNFPP